MPTEAAAVTSRFGSSAAPYRVECAAFAGPIDLLVHLVSTHGVDILDLQLATIVDGFCSALDEAPESIPIEVRSHFLLMAATLTELKSRSLLPSDQEDEDPLEISGFEERDLLLSRLLEHRAYMALSSELDGLFAIAARSVPREAGLDDGFELHAPDLLTKVSPELLAQAYLRSTQSRPIPMVDLKHVTVDVVTVTETVQSLAHRLPEQGRVSFTELTGHLGNNVEVIVHFLAVLELCKLGKIEVEQAERFGEMQIAWVTTAPGDVEELVGADYDG